MNSEQILHHSKQLIHHFDEDDFDLFEDENADNPDAIPDLDAFLREQEADSPVAEEDEKETIRPHQPYQFYASQHLEEGELPFGRVIGHETQKKEILNVLDWFSRSQELKARGISIPRAVLLLGDPGCGKTLLIKEFIRCANTPTFVFKGDETNVPEAINEVFAKAREVGHAIIVFDELDLLINKERRVVRALQENLDGVESDGDDILVLAATNSLNGIADALLRPGRFDKRILVPYPTNEEAVTLLKKYFEDFKVALPEDFDQEEVGVALANVSCAGIKALVNDIVLRNGFEGITSDMIHDSIFGTTNEIKGPESEPIMDICIHESAHALVAHAYPQYFTINRLTIDGPSGQFAVKEVKEDFWPYAKAIADIEISMAGLIGQRLFCGTGSRGCESDLQRARKSAYNLFNMVGYSSIWETLPPMTQSSREESQWKRRRMERKIERFLRKTERRTTRYLKAHETEVRAVAEELFKKKRLKSSEILALLK